MEQEINENNFLEYGEHNGNLYGTHLDSIRNVIKEGLSKKLTGNDGSLTNFWILGKMCVLDCAPSALKLLHNSPEFMPFVIFVAAPGMEQLKQLYAERRAAGGSQRNLAVSFKKIVTFAWWCRLCHSNNCLIYVVCNAIPLNVLVWPSKLDQVQLTSRQNVGILGVSLWGEIFVARIVLSVNLGFLVNSSSFSELLGLLGVSSRFKYPKRFESFEARKKRIKRFQQAFNELLKSF